MKKKVKPQKNKRKPPVLLLIVIFVVMIWLISFFGGSSPDEYLIKEKPIKHGKNESEAIQVTPTPLVPRYVRGMKCGVASDVIETLYEDHSGIEIRAEDIIEDEYTYALIEIPTMILDIGELDGTTAIHFEAREDITNEFWSQLGLIIKAGCQDLSIEDIQTALKEMEMLDEKQDTKEMRLEGRNNSYRLTYSPSVMRGGISQILLE